MLETDNQSNTYSKVDRVGISGMQNFFSNSVSEITDISNYQYIESIDPDKHPAHFLDIYDGEELLGYLQYGYFSPNGFKPFYYIAQLENISGRKGIGKRLMNDFLSNHSRIFLDDNAHIDGVRTSGYYQQFGLSKLPNSNIWYCGFKDSELAHIPILYTRTIFGEIRNNKNFP